MTKRLTSLTLMLALLLVLVTGSALADEESLNPVVVFLAQETGVDPTDIQDLKDIYGLGNVARAYQYLLATLTPEEVATVTAADIQAVLDERTGGWGQMYDDNGMRIHPGGRGLGSLIGGQRGLALGHQKHDNAGTTGEAGYPGPPTDNPNAGPKWGEGGGPPGPPANTPGPKPDKGPGNGNGNGHSNSQGNGHSNNNGRGHTENSNPDEGGE